MVHDSLTDLPVDNPQKSRKEALMLFKGFTTALAAIAISCASFSAAPAQADRKDIAKVIAGAAALAIVGAAIADYNNNRRSASRYRGYTYYDPYFRSPPYGYQRNVYRQHHYKRPKHRYKTYRRHW